MAELGLNLGHLNPHHLLLATRNGTKKGVRWVIQCHILFCYRFWIVGKYRHSWTLWYKGQHNLWRQGFSEERVLLPSLKCTWEGCRSRKPLGTRTPNTRLWFPQRSWPRQLTTCQSVFSSEKWKNCKVHYFWILPASCWRWYKILFPVFSLPFKSVLTHSIIHSIYP